MRPLIGVTYANHRHFGGLTAARLALAVGGARSTLLRRNAREALALGGLILGGGIDV